MEKKKYLNKLSIPELLYLPSGLQEMGTETFLHNFSEEKHKKIELNSTEIYIVYISQQYTHSHV